jgi:hypothetical protein
VTNLSKDFFISYTKLDLHWAEWIAWQLEEAGYSIEIQSWDFRPGSNFVVHMHEASRGSERTIAVISPDYLNAKFTYPEWAAAFKQDPKGTEGILLLVHVRECKQELTGLLGSMDYIDLVGLDESAAQKTLLEGVQRSRAKPSIKPNFPGSLTNP